MAIKKWTDLDAITDLAVTDILCVSHDVPSTPISKKITAANFLKTELHLDQTTPQTVGSDPDRVAKIYVTDLDVTNEITGTVAAVTGLTLNSNALELQTGNIVLVGNVDDTSVLTVGSGAVSVSGTNTGDQDLSAYVAKALFNGQTILAAVSDNDPQPLSITEQTVVGRATGGDVTTLAIDSDLSSVSANDDTVPSAKATKAALDLKADASALGSYVTKALFDAHTVLAATTDDTPAAVTIGEQQILGRVTSGSITALDIDSDLSSVSATDNTVPSAKATKAALDLKADTSVLGNYVTKALFDAHTVLYATTDDTPAALTVTEQTVVGRATGGNITALAIDSDLSSVSANDDTIPSAKATKAALDLKSDTTHTHYYLMASDGDPNPALTIDAAGNITAGLGTSPFLGLYVESETYGSLGVNTKTPDVNAIVTINLPTDDTRKSIFFRNNALAHPVTDILPAEVFASFGTGPYYGYPGLSIIGVSDDGCSSAHAIQVLGIMGASDPVDTTAAIILKGAKSNGVTDAANLGDSETILQVAKYDDTVLASLIGDGKFGLGVVPLGKLQIQHTISTEKALLVSNPGYAHGLTDVLPTDCYLAIAQAGADTYGMPHIIGISDGTAQGLYIEAITKTKSADNAVITISMEEGDGSTGKTNVGSLDVTLRLYGYDESYYDFRKHRLDIVSGTTQPATAILPAAVTGAFLVDTGGGTECGLTVLGISDTDCSGHHGLELRGIVGAADPEDNVGAIVLRAGKSNGSTGAANIGSDETAFEFQNNDMTTLARLRGNGDLELGDGTLGASFIDLLDATDTYTYTIIPGDLAANIDLTIPDGMSSDTFVFEDTAQTMTNKRITKRQTSETSSATPTINTDNADVHVVSALATDITSMTTNLSGTPTDKQCLQIWIKDNGTARDISWGASFQNFLVTLPTATELGKWLVVSLQYLSADSKWCCMDSASQA